MSRVVALAALAGVAVLTVASLPEIKRYLKIRSM
ncbi:MAG: DUF6893 family small protein [Jatrophihabitantaceae bacterium]